MFTLPFTHLSLPVMVKLVVMKITQKPFNESVSSTRPNIFTRLKFIQDTLWHLRPLPNCFFFFPSQFLQRFRQTTPMLCVCVFRELRKRAFIYNLPSSRLSLSGIKKSRIRLKRTTPNSPSVREIPQLAHLSHYHNSNTLPSTITYPLHNVPIDWMDLTSFVPAPQWHVVLLFSTSFMPNDTTLISFSHRGRGRLTIERTHYFCLETRAGKRSGLISYAIVFLHNGFLNTARCKSQRQK